jgi:type VI secretion system protein ImpB
MADSLQHKLDRVRRPRVQITYDVHTGGAMKKVELPFVVGVLADLSGQPKEALRPLKERKAVFIDRDNFNDVLAKAGTRLALRVPNMLTDPNSKLAVELNIKHMDDFEPARVAEQIGPLKQLLEMRQELTQLLNRMEGNDKLGELLESILANQEKALALGQYIDKQSQSAAAKSAPAAKPPASTAPAAAPKAPASAAPPGGAPAPKPAAPAGSAPAAKPPAPAAPPGAAPAPKPAAPAGAAPAPKPAAPAAPPTSAPAPKPAAPPAPEPGGGQAPG